MNIAILTKEYPPHIYGGAGAHVAHLTRELGKLDGGAHEVQILCFGDQDEISGKRRVRGIHPPQSIQVYDERHRTLVDTLERNGAMVGVLQQADVIHCHTWYTHLAGCLLREMLNAPLLLTTHSLEAAATLEKGAARHGLPGLLLDRENGLPERGRGDRRVSVHASRMSTGFITSRWKRSPSSTMGSMMTFSDPKTTLMFSSPTASTRPGPMCSW